MKRVIRNVVFVLLACIVFACARSYPAAALFTSAPAVPPGTPVMVGQQRIGRTGRATVIAGMLHVELELTTPDALPDETILVLEHDPHGVQLLAHTAGAPLHLDPDQRFTFVAAASALEYWQLRLRTAWQKIQ